MLPVALFWAGLALYTRHTDQMRTLEVSPLVCIRDGVQVVAMLPHHEKARLEWEILQDGEVYHQQMRDLIDLVVRLVSRGCLYAPAAILAGAGLLVWGFPQDGIPVRTVDVYTILHDKVIVADKRNTEVGSFNFSRAADRSNSENVLVVWDDPVVAHSYLNHWASRWAQGTDWQSTY